MTPATIRAAFRSVFDRALEAVEPAGVTRRAVPSGIGRVRVLALGKAAAAMTRGAAEALGGRMVDALVVSDHRESVPEKAILVLGAHPIPDEDSEYAGNALLEAATGNLLVLVSGGGSALAEVPPAGIAIGELAATQRALMAAGVPIEDLNVVRRHLSLLKNGGLARRATSVHTLLISDVIDGPPSMIASGPTIADTSTPAEALAIIDHAGVTVPASIRTWLSSGGGAADATAGTWSVIADGPTALMAVRDSLRDQGHTVSLVTTVLRGDAVERARWFIDHVGRGVTALACGETTVRVAEGGVGGRNQHAALAAAIAIEGREVVFAGLATDGVDGPTTAAGAIVDGGSCGRMRAKGVDPVKALADCDSHIALEASGDLVVTGPTGTNVGDIWMAWRSERAAEEVTAR